MVRFSQYTIWRSSSLNSALESSLILPKNQNHHNHKYWTTSLPQSVVWHVQLNSVQMLQAPIWPTLEFETDPHTRIYLSVQSLCQACLQVIHLWKLAGTEVGGSSAWYEFCRKPPRGNWGHHVWIIYDDPRGKVATSFLRQVRILTEPTSSNIRDEIIQGKRPSTRETEQYGEESEISRSYLPTQERILAKEEYGWTLSRGVSLIESIRCQCLELETLKEAAEITSAAACSLNSLYLLICWLRIVSRFLQLKTATSYVLTNTGSCWTRRRHCQAKV